MSRDITKVIPDILAVIPADQHAVRAQLENLAHSAFYTPPELQGPFWLSMSTILTNELGSPGDVPWKREVARICANRTVQRG